MKRLLLTASLLALSVLAGEDFETLARTFLGEGGGGVAENHAAFVNLGSRERGEAYLRLLEAAAGRPEEGYLVAWGPVALFGLPRELKRDFYLGLRKQGVPVPLCVYDGGGEAGAAATNGCRAVLGELIAAADEGAVFGDAVPVREYLHSPYFQVGKWSRPLFEYEKFLLTRAVALGESPEGITCFFEHCAAWGQGLELSWFQGLAERGLELYARREAKERPRPEAGRGPRGWRPFQSDDSLTLLRAAMGLARRFGGEEDLAAARKAVVARALEKNAYPGRNGLILRVYYLKSCLQGLRLEDYREEIVKAFAACEDQRVAVNCALYLLQGDFFAGDFADRSAGSADGRGTRFSDIAASFSLTNAVAPEWTDEMAAQLNGLEPERLFGYERILASLGQRAAREGDQAEVERIDLEFRLLTSQIVEGERTKGEGNAWWRGRMRRGQR